ncbi:AAA family ATPase, partial [Lacticaseibacillus paracasei]
EADSVWAEFFDGISALRNDKEMIIYLVAHTQITTAKGIETEPFDKYCVKLHKRPAATVQEKADIVGFLHRTISTADHNTTKTGKSDPAKSVRGGGL